MARTVTFDVELVDEEENPVERTLTAKSMSLAPGKIIELMVLEEPRSQFMLLQWGFTEEDYDWFRSLPLAPNADPLLEAWQKASDADLGKSKGSTKSSPSTKGRSKQT